MKRSLLAVFLVLGCRAKEVQVTPEPVPAPELPEVCKPWKPGPEYHQEKPEEVEPIPGERMDRMICSTNGVDGECQAFSMVNAHRFEENHLWPMMPGQNYRAPYECSQHCEEPWTSDVVECQEKVSDVDRNIVELVDFTCRGDRVCQQSEQCCQVKKRSKVFIKYEPPSKEQSDQWEKERCERLENRKATCQPFCTSPKYASECAGYWGVTCGHGA